MRSTRVLAAATAVVAMALAGSALADTMHPTLGAKLSGMGEHGVVNLTQKASMNEICWTFDVMTDGVTGASIRDAHGMTVAKFGSMYKSKGCAIVPMKALKLIEAKPGSYWVWVDTKGHPGDLRGKLFARMAHM